MKKIIISAVITLLIVGGVIIHQNKVNALKNEILGVETALDTAYQPTEVEQKEIRLVNNRIERSNIQSEIDKDDKIIEEANERKRVNVEKKRQLNKEADETKEWIDNYYGLGL